MSTLLKFRCSNPDCRHVIEARVPPIRCRNPGCGRTSSYVQCSDNEPVTPVATNVTVTNASVTSPPAPTAPVAPPVTPAVNVARTTTAPPPAVVVAPVGTPSAERVAPPARPVVESSTAEPPVGPAAPAPIHASRATPVVSPMAPTAVAPPEPVFVPPPVVTPAPPSPAPPPAPVARLAWRYRPLVAAGQRTTPVLSGPVVDERGRVFVALGPDLLMFEPGSVQPAWSYATGGPVVGSPALGPDGLLRVHSTDEHVHFVNDAGERALPPVAVGPPLARATPLVDAQARTWVARHDGGLVRIAADGSLAKRPFVRSRRRFDCVGVLRDEVLYVGAEDHYVRAIDLSGEQGANRWDDSPGKGRTHCPITTPLAVSPSGEILAVSQDDHLYAFRTDGELAWKFTLPGQVPSSPKVTRHGLILVGVGQSPRGQAGRGILLAIDGATQAVRWQVAVDAPIESTPVIGDDDIAYCGDNSGAVHAVDVVKGRTVWRESLGIPVRSVGAIWAPRQVVFGLDDGSLVALDCSSQRSA